MKIDKFFCLNGDILNLFLQKCLLSSPLSFIWLLSKSLNMITRATKRVNFRKMLKNQVSVYRTIGPLVVTLCWPRIGRV